MRNLSTMNKILGCLTAVFLLLAVPAISGAKDPKTDFALFDGTNPANLDGADKTGVLCGNLNKDLTALEAKHWTYYFTGTNFSGADAECRVIYTDGDFVRYKIPADTSFSLSEAGGANEFNSAVRWSCDEKIAGAGSAIGQKRNFCLSCDETGDGDTACDNIIPN